MSNLRSYKELYFYLFGAIADAVEAMEQGNIALAYDRLIHVQQEAEQACLAFDILPDR